MVVIICVFRVEVCDFLFGIFGCVVIVESSFVYVVEVVLGC